MGLWRRSDQRLDAVERVVFLRDILQRKKALRRFYEETYARFRACIERAPHAGQALEIGSGGGFCRDVIPEIITSDVLSYNGVERVIDACALSFEAGSLRAICGLNVFHHIRDVARFLAEADRTLISGGRVFLVDPYPGLLARPIYKYLHHEAFDPDVAEDWRLTTHGGPVSNANDALAWVVFERDRRLFEQRFPRLSLVRFEPHSPLCYWLAGGLRKWSLLPSWAYASARWLDDALLALSPRFGSFVDIELVKR